jgi:hypothetical protein
MNAYEEEIQKSLENGETPQGDELDVKAYRQVFRMLGKDPAYELPGDFASRVAARVNARQQARDSRDYLWFAAGIVFLAITSLATILFTGFRFDFGFLKAMSDYKGLAAFAIAFLVFLNWLDKRLVGGRRAHP